MKIRKIAYLSTLFAFLLPTLVVATVVLSYTYPTSTSNVTPQIYLTTGPEYTTANSLGLISAQLSSTTPYYISSGTTITINFVAGAGQEALLNVLQIVNGTTGKTSTQVSVYIEAALPTGITMYAGTSEATATISSSSGSSSILVNAGTNGISISSSSYTPVVSAGTSWSTIYLSFLNTGATGTGYIYIYYTVT
ncbi:MAG: hypothetical protein GPW18_05475 [Euryarchaeota archaeon]|nr:hypothetical protein [Euryarchaeota archaeon]